MERTLHEVKAGARNGDYTIPELVTFEAFVMGRPNEKLTEASEGCYYNSRYGIIYIECGTFPTQWSENEVVHIDIINPETEYAGQGDIILGTSTWFSPNPIVFEGFPCEAGQGTGISYNGEECVIDVCKLPIAGSHQVDPNVTFDPESGAVIVRVAVLESVYTGLQGYCSLAYILFLTGNTNQTFNIKLSYDGWNNRDPLNIHYYDGQQMTVPENIVWGEDEVTFTIANPGSGVCFYLKDNTDAVKESDLIDLIEEQKIKGGKMDLKETNELLDKLQDLANAVKADSEDGKLTVLEILGNYPEVLAVIDEGKDYIEILAELKDLDPEEIQTLTMKLFGFIFTVLDIVKNLK